MEADKTEELLELINITFDEDKNIHIELKDKEAFIEKGTGNLLIEYIEDALGDADVVECNEINGGTDGLWIMGGTYVYFFRGNNIAELKKEGKTTMNQEGSVVDCIDTSNENDLEFLKWYYSSSDVDEAVQQMYDDNGWVVTDIDTYQAYDELEKDKLYTFRENRNGVMVEKILDYGKMEYKDIIKACTSFGYSEREINEWLPKKQNIPLILECVFESK